MMRGPSIWLDDRKDTLKDDFSLALIKSSLKNNETQLKSEKKKVKSEADAR